MKKLVALLSLLAVVSAYPQGSVNFQNRGIVTPSGTVSSPVTYGTGGPMAAGSRVSSLVTGTDATTGIMYGGLTPMAGLYGGNATATEGQLVLLVPAVGFRSGSLFSGYVNVGTSGERVVPGVPAGQVARLQIRAWDSGNAQDDTYEKAAARVSANNGVYLGMSGIIEVSLKTAPDTPPDLVDRTTGQAINAFTMNYYVPEPSIIGLGILGAIAGLMVFRRRN